MLKIDECDCKYKQINLMLILFAFLFSIGYHFLGPPGIFYGNNLI